MKSWQIELMQKIIRLISLLIEAHNYIQKSENVNLIFLGSKPKMHFYFTLSSLMQKILCKNSKRKTKNFSLIPAKRMRNVSILASFCFGAKNLKRNPTRTLHENTISERGNLPTYRVCREGFLFLPCNN